MDLKVDPYNPHRAHSNDLDLRVECSDASQTIKIVRAFNGYEAMRDGLDRAFDELFNLSMTAPEPYASDARAVVSRMKLMFDQIGER